MMLSVLGLSGQGISLVLLTLLMCISLAVAEVGSASDLDPNEQPDEVRRGMPLRPDGKSRTQLFFERIASSIEPDLKGSPDRLALYVDQFQRMALNDPRLIAFDARADWDASRDTVVLSGHVEFDEQRESLAAFLSVLGFTTIENRIELMPTADLGDRPFALISAPSAFVYASPDEKSEKLTQARQGDAVFLLKPAEAGFYYCHAWDGYVGFIPESQVKRADSAALAAALPGVPADRFDPAIQAGRALQGTPYQWGGTTSDGIDCSGLTRHCYRQIGIILPRDTDQQALVGRLTATRTHRDNMQRGDLMFFLNPRGRINHTAIYLGDGKFLESGGPGVRIASLDPRSPDYVEKRDKGFAFAKRVLETVHD